MSHTYVFPNTECIFSAKSFNLGNLSLLNNLRKLPAVCNTVSIVYFYWKLLRLFYLKSPIAGMWSLFCSGATLRRPRLAQRQTDLFGVTEFIAPDALSKTTNAVTSKNHKGYSDRCPCGRLAEGRIFYSTLIVK